MKRKLTMCILAAVGLAAQPLAQDKPLYENNFQNAELDKAPGDLLVLDGGFAVKQEGEQKFLELPGAPLESFGALFGPTEKEGVVVLARIQSAGKGRRFPTFGVGLGGAAGYRLQVAPAKKAVELFKGDTLKASAPFDWKSDSWTRFRLQLRKAKDGEWQIEGKVWAQGGEEPAAWTITCADNEEPRPGRAAIYGSPFAGTPIRFDDLVVLRLPAPRGG